MDRRELIQTGTAAAAGITLLKPLTAFGYAANSAIRHGLLGCGNRGTSVANSFSQNTSAQVVALADLFPDNLAVGRSHFDQLNADSRPRAHRLEASLSRPARLRATRRIADIDLIQISTPPFFHVQHLEAAVASGKHVYCEKPVGIDIHQANHALEIAKRVKSTQSVDVGFQCRNAPPLAAIAERIHAGRSGQDRPRFRHLLRTGFYGKESPRRRSRRISPAQLALGSRHLGRHPGRAEYSHHRFVQLASRRASS
jgi:myo-inositol 2-dehydrogenase/D-chiro-inositol 1-dehydrogenase